MEVEREIMCKNNRIKIGRKQYEIRDDRDALDDIICVMRDDEFSDEDKEAVVLVIFYLNAEEIPKERKKDAFEKCLRYVCDKVGYIEKTVVYRFPPYFRFPRYCGEKNMKGEFSRRSSCEDCPLLESGESYYCHITKSYDDKDDSIMEAYGWDEKQIEKHKARRAACPFYEGKDG